MVAFATPGVSSVCKRSTKRDPLEEAREEKAFGLWKEAKMALHFFSSFRVIPVSLLEKERKIEGERERERQQGEWPRPSRLLRTAAS